MEDLEEEDNAVAGGGPLVSGQSGLSDRVILFCEEYARHGDNLTQPQYAARFGVSDRQIRRWLNRPEVQTRIRELKRAALIDPSTIEHLSREQLQELRDRLDQLEGGVPRERLDPLLVDLQSLMMKLDEKELFKFYHKTEEVIHDVMVQRGCHHSFRTRTIRELSLYFDYMKELKRDNMEAGSAGVMFQTIL